MAHCLQGKLANLDTSKNKMHSFTSAQVSDCDGTACGGELCRNGGECDVTDGGADFECACAEPFEGRRCEEHRLCTGASGCHNGGVCRANEQEEEEEEDGGSVRCDCPLGFSGHRCQEGIINYISTLNYIKFIC